MSSRGVRGEGRGVAVDFSDEAQETEGAPSTEAEVQWKEEGMTTSASARSRGSHKVQGKENSRENKENKAPSSGANLCRECSKCAFCRLGLSTEPLDKSEDLWSDREAKYTKRYISDLRHIMSMQLRTSQAYMEFMAREHTSLHDWIVNRGHDLALRNVDNE